MLGREVKNIAIIGAGLAGLVSVIECINQAKQFQNDSFKINIIEKRSLDFNRRQKLILCRLIASPTYPAVYWQDFCEKNFDPYGDIKRKFVHFNKTQQMTKPLNHREKFLFKLWRQEDYFYHDLRKATVFKNFSIKELQLALFEHIQNINCSNVEIVWHQPAIVKSINPHSNELTLENTITKNIYPITFNDIIVAEGGKRETTELFNQQLNHPFNFKRFHFPTLYHASARLKLKTPINQNKVACHNQDEFLSRFKNTYPNKYSKDEVLKKFQMLGYHSNTLPNFFIVDDNYYKYQKDQTNLRLYVVSEIPESIHLLQGEKKRQTIIAWCKLMASLTYNISDEYFEFDSKGENNNSQINALTFSNELSYVDVPFFKLSQKNHIYLVGDAAISNFYPLGFSSVIAATEASFVSQLVCCNNRSLNNYSKLCNDSRLFLVDSLENISRQLHRDFQEEYRKETNTSMDISQ